MLKNKFIFSKFNFLLKDCLILLVLSLVSCVPNISNNLRTRSSNSSVATATPGIGQGYILADNPIILTSDPNLSPEYNLSSLLSVANITNNTYLSGGSGCANYTYCFEVKALNTDATSLQTTDGKWGFDANTSQFLQVNSYYHVNKILEYFFADLAKSYAMSNYALNNNSNTSLPQDIQSGSKYNLSFSSNPLQVYANCDEKNNASFKAAKMELCFGYLQDHPNMKWAQDSSVIYHETGHFLQYMQLNFNNSANPQHAMMGNYQYDEAGAIGEGLSDYFSYYVNQRTHFAEWGAGRVLGASRPISEDDSLHAPALAKESGRRLSYPDYLDYNPNDQGVPDEDVHVSGMVISHFLVAFTEDLMSKCSISKRDAQSQVMILLNETLAELGDLTTVGTVSKPSGSLVKTTGKINLSVNYALKWFSTVNPINYRKFAQTFSKNVLRASLDPSVNLCYGNNTYSKDNLEQLLDEYGLLLFRTYNENRNFSDPAVPAKRNTPVTSTNRNKTVLISKDLLQLDPTPNTPTAYIIDNKETITQGIADLQKSGMITNLSSDGQTQVQSEAGYNNGNGKVSPGEIVAIGLNVYNNSNSTMGNVQILANDWNNLGPTGKPCIYDSSMSTDSNWTTTAEGGEPCTTVNASSEADFQPICVMQYNGANSTQWLSQHSFKNKLALDSNFCLNTANDKDCFIKAITGTDQANYSKINPKKNWFQTVQNPNVATAQKLSWGNVVLFQISKQIPPGTVVDCRFRARFTNCEDCYHNSANQNYDYSDKDFNGPKPFKIIHLQMTIID